MASKPIRVGRTCRAHAYTTVRGRKAWACANGVVRGIDRGYAAVMRSGVLFDIDDTLFDTIYLHAAAWWEAPRQQGADVPMAKIHRAIGMGADNLLDHLLGPGRDRDRDEQASAQLPVYPVGAIREAGAPHISWMLEISPRSTRSR